VVDFAFFHLFPISFCPRASAASPCFSISAILEIMAILAISPYPRPTPYVHPIPPKVTQSTQGSAEGRRSFSLVLIWLKAKGYFFKYLFLAHPGALPEYS
jgi:hypothetical protein